MMKNLTNAILPNTNGLQTTITKYSTFHLVSQTVQASLEACIILLNVIFSSLAKKYNYPSSTPRI